MIFQDNQHTKWQQMLAVTSQHADILPPLFKNKNRLMIGRFIAENVLMTLLQYVGLMFVMMTLVPSPIWLATGTACAFSFMRGLTIMPGVFLGGMLTFFSQDITLGMTAICSGIYMVQTLVLLWVTQQLISPSLVFHRVCSYLGFVAASGIITAIAAFLLASISYSFTDACLRWWLANWCSILVFGLGLVTWDAYFAELDYLKRSSRITIYALYGLLAVNSVAILFFAGQTQLFLLLVDTCLLVLLSAKYGWGGAVAANCLINIIFSVASFMEVIVLYNQSTVPFQIWLIANAVMSILVAMNTTSVGRSH
ncbi:MAG: hypothetical protein WAW86_06750 [Gammaproteobacteria bacterium]